MKAIGKTVRAVHTSGDTESGEKWAELEDIPAYENGFIAELKGNSIILCAASKLSMQF